MVYTMLKSTYTKLEPKILRKRSYKDFNKESFLQDLQHGLITLIILLNLMMHSKQY